MPLSECLTHDRRLIEKTAEQTLVEQWKESDGNKSLAHKNVDITKVIRTAELAADGVINKKQRRDQEDDIVAFESSNMALKSEVSLPRPL